MENRTTACPIALSRTAERLRTSEGKVDFSLAETTLNGVTIVISLSSDISDAFPTNLGPDEIEIHFSVPKELNSLIGHSNESLRHREMLYMYLYGIVCNRSKS